MKSIKQKLLVIFGCIIILLIVISVLGIYYLNEIDSHYQQGIEQTEKVKSLTEHSLATEVQFKTQVQEWKNILIRGNNPEQYQQYFQQFEETEENVQNNLALIKKIYTELDLNTEIIDLSISQHQTLGEEYRKGLRNFDSNDLDTGKKVDTFVKGIDRPYSDTFEQIREEINNYYDEYQLLLEADMNNKLKLVQLQFLIGLIVAIITAVLLAIILASRITQPLALFGDVLKEVGNGVLTSEIPSKLLKRKDELGDLATSLNFMLIETQHLVGQIHKMSEEVTIHSTNLLHISKETTAFGEEVATKVDEIASASMHQATDIESTAQNISQLSDLIEKDQHQVKELNNSIQQVMILKDEGLQNLQLLVQKTEQNERASVDINTVMKNTQTSVEQIYHASEMIQNIANQTNLLALNASIEASRAGEAGKGFSVVAEEIRKLAELTKQFTNEISSYIQDLQAKTDIAVSTIEEVSDIVKEQSSSVDDTKHKFIGITDAIERTKEIIHSLNQSSESMEMENNNIVHVIQQLSTVSKENAVGAEYAQEAIEEQTVTLNGIENANQQLMRLAEEMNESIKKFKY